jgi:hypothetical protein
MQTNNLQEALIAIAVIIIAAMYILFSYISHAGFWVGVITLVCVALIVALIIGAVKYIRMMRSRD